MTIDPRIAHLADDLELIANGDEASEAPAAPLPPGVQDHKVTEDLARDEADAKPPSQATRLVALALEEVDLFRSPDGVAFAAVRVGDHRETWPLRSKHFRTWLQRSLYVADRKVPGAQAVQDALGVLEGRALFEAPEEAVALRVAGDDSVIHLDLGDDTWQAVEVSSTGWRLAEPAVRMRRSPSVVALPAPVAGGSIDTLRRFINVRDDRDWQLLVAWLVAAFRPRGPYPVLVLHGEHGAAKSSVARLLRALIDPSASPLRSDPRNAHDLMIGASNGWIVAYDNLSGLPVWLSDALCRLSTGGGFATRELYSDNEETIFEAQRPVILTGIEELATRGDLLDRALVVSLPTIPESERRSERELWTDFERLRPSILGALLDAAACAVRELPATRLDAAPRMADFAEWIVAAESALPWAPGEFLAAYSGNRGEANELTLEESPIGSPVRELAQNGFEGTAEDLLERLEGIAGEAATRRKEWPKSPRALSGKLRRIAPNLRALGIEVEFGKEPGGGRRRLITLGLGSVQAVSQGSRRDGRDGRDGRSHKQSRERDEPQLNVIPFAGRRGAVRPATAEEDAEVERLRAKPGDPP
jgi:hypothetical protein